MSVSNELMAEVVGKAKLNHERMIGACDDVSDAMVDALSGINRKHLLKLARAANYTRTVRGVHPRTDTPHPCGAGHLSEHTTGVESMIPQSDIELVESLAQLGSAQFAADLRSVLDAVRVISLEPEVRHLHVGVSFDFDTWAASPIDELSVHLCQCDGCDEERASVSWKEHVLDDSSKVSRVLGGISIAGEQREKYRESRPWVAGPLEGCCHENLHRLVKVSRALRIAPAIQNLAEEIRKFVTVAPVVYFGFYLIVDVPRPRDITDVVFHWCDQNSCEENPAVGRQRPTTLGNSNGLPNTIRICGHSSEQLRRPKAEEA